MNEQEIARMIEAGLPGSLVKVSGDGRHFEAIVVSATFEGKSMLEQHRQVYAALGDSFRTDALHALSLKTHTPQEWEALAGGREV